MKKITYIIILALIINVKSNAQLPPPGGYLTNTTMAAFHGTWQWVNGTDSVKLFLDTKKVWINYGDGFFADILVGWHMYKRGNAIIESSYSNINNGNTYTFFGSNENEPTRTAAGNFHDLSKHKEVNLNLSLNAIGDKIVWKLDEAEGMRVRVAGDLPLAVGFTLPDNIVLTKQ